MLCTYGRDKLISTTRGVWRRLLIDTPEHTTHPGESSHYELLYSKPRTNVTFRVYNSFGSSRFQSTTIRNWKRFPIGHKLHANATVAFGKRSLKSDIGFDFNFEHRIRSFYDFVVLNVDLRFRLFSSFVKISSAARVICEIFVFHRRIHCTSHGWV